MRTTIICYYLKHNSTTEPSGLISHQWLCWGSTDPEPRRSARWGESTGLTVKFSAHPQARRYLSCLSLKKTKHEKTISFIWSTFINVLYIKMQARNRKIPEIKDKIQQPFLHFHSCIVPAFILQYLINSSTNISLLQIYWYPCTINAGRWLKRDCSTETSFLK